VSASADEAPVQYPAAGDACLKSMKTDPARFYGPAHAFPLGTGLLVRDCVLATAHPTEVRFETGVGLGLVITHECDVDQSNNRYFNDLVLVCPIIPLDNFCLSCEEEEGPGAWGGILPAIAADTVYRAMYLPPLPKGWPLHRKWKAAVFFILIISHLPEFNGSLMLRNKQFVRCPPTDYARSISSCKITCFGRRQSTCGLCAEMMKRRELVGPQGRRGDFAMGGPTNPAGRGLVRLRRQPVRELCCRFAADAVNRLL
jgi:hypothetical protein